MSLLYGSGQPRSFRVLWALEEANMPYEYRKVKFGSEGINGTKSEEYRSFNSQGKVPTLVDVGVPIVCFVGFEELRKTGQP